VSLLLIHPEDSVWYVDVYYLSTVIRRNGLRVPAVYGLLNYSTCMPTANG